MALKLAAAAAAALILSATQVMAGPTYTFTTSEGLQPSNFATITLTQVNITTVNVLLDIFDTTLPAPRYGLINSGNHTPFAFTLAGTETGVSASFLQPVGGSYAFGIFSLSTTNGPNPPFGTYGVSIDSTAPNGSGSAYYGDLEFNVSRTGGLSTDDFILNPVGGPGGNGPAYFTADVTDGRTTGAQAWKIRTTPITPVPEPTSMGLGILGAALAGMGFLRRQKNRNA